MKRALTSLAALALAAPTFATHQILYKGETTSPQPVEETISAPFYNEHFDEFRYFISDEGERKNGEYDESEDEYTTIVTNGAYRWSAVYHDPEEEDGPYRAPTNTLAVFVTPCAQMLEDPWGKGGEVKGMIYRAYEGPETSMVELDVEYTFPGFTFSHWEITNTAPPVVYQEGRSNITFFVSTEEYEGPRQYILCVACFNGYGHGNTNELVKISVDTDETNGGSVTGNGYIRKGGEFGIQAFDSRDYVFDYWTEGGIVIKSGSSFSGTANSDRSFVAHFKPAPRFITCRPNCYYFDDNSVEINEAWISSVDGVPYERGTHTVTATRGQRVTIMADGKRFSEARVRKASSSLHRDADRDDSWTLEHTFTVQDSEDWIVFFGKRDEILRNTGGSILCQGY